MKINSRIRKKTVKRIISRLEKELERREKYPYGFSDPLEIFDILEYWDKKLYNLTVF